MKQLSILFCLIGSLLYSQDCKLSLNGTVKDFHDGKVIQDATIYIKQLNKFTTSNTNGVFSFNNICKGKYTVIVSHISCDTKTLEIELNDSKVIDVLLEHHIQELEEVRVKGSGGKQTKTSQETTIRVKDIEQFSNSSLGDALKQVSGVSSINTGNTIVKPVINGLHSSRLAIITNGVRLQDQEWGIEHAPNIDINATEGISVIKGADALAFGGDAIGGVVLLKPTKVILLDSLYGKTILSGQTNGRGFSISSMLTKTFEKGWYITGQGTYKRFGDFEAPDYNLTNTGLNSKSFSLNTGYKTVEKGFNAYYSYVDNTIGILRASHIGNVEDLVNAINNPKPLIEEEFSYDIIAPRQEVKHHLAKLEFYKRLKSFGKLSFQYDFQLNNRLEFDVRVGDDRNKQAVDLELKTHTLKANLKIDNNLDNTYDVGLTGTFQNNFANPDTGVKRLIPDYNRFDFGAYAILTLRLNEETIMNFGARYDFNRYDAKKFYTTSRWGERNYDSDFSDIIIEDLGTQLLTNPVFNYHNVSASVGLSYNLNDSNSLKFNYSLSNRAPNPSELFSDGLHHSAARIELGDLRIDTETSNRFGAGYYFDNDKFSITAESFVNLVNDFIYLEPVGTQQTIRGAFPVWNYNQTSVSIIGIDFAGNYNFSKSWSISNKSSIIKGWDQSNDIALIDMPPFETETTLKFIKPEWKNLSLNLTSQLVLRQNLFPNNNFETYIPTTDEFVTVDISTPPDGYHLLHFRGSFDQSLGKSVNLTVGLQVNNIFNTAYRNYLNRLRFFADDLGRNIQLQTKINF